MSAPFRTATGGRIDRAARLRSPSTARLRGLRRRYAGLGAARQRRASRRPLVQISPAARHLGRRRGTERAGRPRARRRALHAQPARDPDRAVRRPASPTSQNRWPSLGSTSARSAIGSRRCFPAGFYYKTFMWPPVRRTGPGNASTSRRSAPPAGLGDAPTRAGPRRLRAAFCPLRRAGGRRRPGGARGRAGRGGSGARVILCDEQAELGGSLLAETRATIDGVSAARLARRRRSTSSPRRTTCALHAAHARRSAITRRISSAWRARLPTISPQADADAPRERLWQVRAQRGRARAAARSSGRWCFPTTTGRA